MTLLRKFKFERARSVETVARTMGEESRSSTPWATSTAMGSPDSPNTSRAATRTGPVGSSSSLPVRSSSAERRSSRSFTSFSSCLIASC